MDWDELDSLDIEKLKVHPEIIFLLNLKQNIYINIWMEDLLLLKNRIRRWAFS